VQMTIKNTEVETSEENPHLHMSVPYTVQLCC